MTLRSEAVADGRSDWSVSVPTGPSDTMQVDTQSGKWLFAESRGEDGELVAFDGSIGDPAVRRHDWSQSEHESRYLQWHLDASLIPIAVAMRYRFDASDVLRVFKVLLRPNVNTFVEDAELLRYMPSGVQSLAFSRLAPRCFDAAPGQRGVTCFASDGRRTHIWRVDPVQGRLEPLGWLDLQLWQQRRSESADRWLIASAACTWRLLDLVANAVATLPLDGVCPSDVAMSGSRLAALLLHDGRYELHVYDLH